MAESGSAFDFVLGKGGEAPALAQESPELQDSIASKESASPRVRRVKGTSSVIAVRLDQAGKIDIDHMRGETLKRLKEAVNKSNLIETKEEKEAVYAMLVPAIYKVAGGIEALAASRFLKVSRSDAQQVFGYTEEEIAVLQQPTANVLAKYSGEWLTSNGDLLALVFHLAAIHQMKLEHLKELQKLRLQPVQAVKRVEQIS